MRAYRVTVIDSYGEQFVVTVTASSVCEALKHIETDKGWNVHQITAIGSEADV